MMMVDPRQAEDLNKNTQSDATFLPAFSGTPQNPKQPDPSVSDIRLPFAFYGLLNGFNDGYMLLKHGFDISSGTLRSTDRMHDWLSTAEGVAVTTLEMSVFMLSSLFANIFDEKQAQGAKKYVVIVWPFVRDILKGLRTGFKGLRNILQLSGNLRGVNLVYLIMPLALFFGILTALNKLLYRSFVMRPRKMLIRDAHKQLESIQCTELDYINRAWLDKQFGEASYKGLPLDNKLTIHRTAAMASIAFDALLESTFQYMSLVGLAAFLPQIYPLYLLIIVFCSLYGMINVIAQLYEEHINQKKLTEVRLQIELAICEKELMVLLNGSKTLSEDEKLVVLKKLIECRDKRDKLYASVTSSNLLALLAGLKAGLTVYAVVTTLLYTIFAFTSLTMVIFPVWLIASGVFLAPVLLLSSTVYSYFQNKKHRAGLEKKRSHQLNFFEVGDDFELLRDQLQNNYSISKKDAKTDCFENTKYAEVARQGLSGGNKGIKFVDVTCNRFQEMGGDGHWQSSSGMGVASLLTGLVYMASYVVRTFVNVESKEITANYRVARLDKLKQGAKTKANTLYLQLVDSSTIEYCFINPNKVECRGDISLSQLLGRVGLEGEQFEALKKNPERLFAELKPAILDYLVKRGNLPLKYRMQDDGYEFCLLEEKTKLQPNKVYLAFDKFSGIISYRVLDKKNNPCDGEIELRSIKRSNGKSWKDFQGTLDEFNESNTRARILDSIADKIKAPVQHSANRSTFFSRSSYTPRIDFLAPIVEGSLNDVSDRITTSPVAT